MAGALLFPRDDPLRPRPGPRSGPRRLRLHRLPQAPGDLCYRKAALERFAALPPSPLELAERLEQLRLLENGIALYVAEAPGDTIGVDTEADLLRAEAVLLGRSAR